MVFWRKKFCDPLSDLLFTLLGQTWCHKWSLKDWTKKDVLKSDKKFKKPYLHRPGIDMVFWRKKFCDPLSDLLFTLLGQTWWPKWSLKDWTKKDVLKSDEKIKKTYLHSPGIDMVFWRKKFSDPMSDVLFTLLGQTWLD